MANKRRKSAPVLFRLTDLLLAGLVLKRLLQTCLHSFRPFKCHRVSRHATDRETSSRDNRPGNRSKTMKDERPNSILSCHAQALGLGSCQTSVR